MIRYGWGCRNCQNLTVLQLFRCPRCGKRQPYKKVSWTMPGNKIRRDFDGEETPEVTYAPGQEPEGWAGTSSSESSKQDETSGSSDKDNHPQPARTTENPSKKEETVNSSAASTAGSGQKTETPSSAKTTPTKATQSTKK
jgi:hypothetical protein